MLSIPYPSIHTVPEEGHVRRCCFRCAIGCCHCCGRAHTTQGGFGHCTPKKIWQLADLSICCVGINGLSVCTKNTKVINSARVHVAMIMHSYDDVY